MMATFQDGLRTMRTIHAVLLFSVFVYAALPEYVLHLRQGTAARIMFYGILFMAGMDVVIAVVFRQARLGPAEEALRANMEDGAALARWRQAQLLPLVLSEAVCLSGFALRFLGAPFARAVPFYGAAIIMMVLFWPKDPRS
jgi:hypothetical protein